MSIQDLMVSRNLTHQKLSKLSGIPDSTLRDILNGEAALENCKAITVSKLAKALELSVEGLLQLEPIGRKQPEPDREGIEAFTFIRYRLLEILYGSNPTAFIRVIHTEKTVEWFFDHQHRATALWLIGLLDYLCDRQGLPRLPQYDHYRQEAIHVLDGHVLCPGWLDDKAVLQLMRHALPQFARFGIVETEETLKQL